MQILSVLVFDQEICGGKIESELATKNPQVKVPKYNIQSLANKLKDIEDLILDANDEEFEFSDDSESKHGNFENDDNDDNDDDLIF